ncbi:hypothetical protein SAMN05421788_101681 [Filimonas lacunae]|uniref:Uncharacterized protein n=1 Tax=Filimonas lacunae TaxID=477680 RepID=A0A1N7L7E6_9BACT|nr:hypothetical protein SAMN05421788_101681 [Filimonas lacunae]
MQLIDKRQKVTAKDAPLADDVMEMDDLWKKRIKY